MFSEFVSNHRFLIIFWLLYSSFMITKVWRDGVTTMQNWFHVKIVQNKMYIIIFAYALWHWKCAKNYNNLDNTGLYGLDKAVNSNAYNIVRQWSMIKKFSQCNVFCWSSSTWCCGIALFSSYSNTIFWYPSQSF